MAADLAYPGRELETFAAAANWHAYWRAQVRPFIGAAVLEVGAGIGTHTVALLGEGVRRWVALEPDAGLAARARDALAGGSGEIRHGTTAALDAEERFDTIFYIDVLEHIADDRGELARSYAHLAPGGYLVVLAPAHQGLYSPFDAAIGHFRRYSARSLRAVGPDGARLERLRYLDAVGLLASAGNRLVLRQDAPTAAQIQLWDRAMVPLSRALDPLFGFRLGKSVLAVWRKPTV